MAGNDDIGHLDDVGERLAGSGGILVSGKVYDEIKNHPSLQTARLGEVGLKNVRHPVTVFAITNEGLSVPSPEEVLAKAGVPDAQPAGIPTAPSSSDQKPLAATTGAGAVLRRLKERAVVQWALVYLSGIWALWEAVSLVGGMVDRVTEPGPTTVVIAVLGLLVTLVLAWYHGEKGRQRVSGPELLMIALLLAIGGGVVTVLGPGGEGLRLSQRAISGLSEGETPAIAVLPFVNMSAGGGEDAAFLATGLHDDLLTQLAKIASLEVIARTSVMQYAGTEKTIPMIGRELGVHVILEGSVLRAGEQVRLNVQLIDVDSDSHLWAETYDREFTVANVFSIQSDLAHRIAAALRIELAPAAEARIAEVPTENAVAYGLYLRGKEAFERPGYDPGDMERARDLMSQAVEADPEFALAHAWLSTVHSWIYWFYDRSELRLEHARAAADEALRLNSDLPEAHLARAYDHFSRYEDEQAWDALVRAEEGLPGSFDVLLLKGQLHFRQWEWDAALAVLERGARLDPFSTEAAVNLGEAYAERDRWGEANAEFDRVLEIDPTFVEVEIMRGYLWWMRTGDGGPVLELLPNLPPDSEVRGLRVFFEWLISPEVEDKIDAFERLDQPTVEFGGFWWAPRELLEGWTYRGLDDERAQRAFEAAVRICLTVLEERPDDPRIHSSLGRAYSALGRREEAVREARLVEEILPITKDPVNGRDLLIATSAIYAELGMVDEVLEALETLLSVPGVPPGGLLVGPDYALVRDDPRFQALVERYGPQTVRE